MKILIIILAVFLYSSAISQVTIGSVDSPHPSTVLELKAGDKGFLAPRVNLIDIWDKVTVPQYVDGLLVLNMNDSGNEIPLSYRVKAGKYYYWHTDRWVEMVVKNTLTENIEQTLSLKGIPRPAIFTLNGTQRIFAKDPVNPGGSGYYPNMYGVINPLAGISVNQEAYLPLAERVNYTAGTVQLNSVNIGGGKTKYTITFQPGIYSIIFTYEFVPADSAEGNHQAGADNCYSAVYFMKFPVTIKNSDGTVTSGLTRVESNCYHGLGWSNPGEGRYADHGNTISYVSVIHTEFVWDFAFGTGNGDTACNGKEGLSMPNRSTFLYISRMGDPD